MVGFKESIMSRCFPCCEYSGNIMLIVALLATVSSLPDPSTEPSSNKDVAALKSQVLHLEQIVSALQSQILSQDQKYAAVLQSVLSKLTETTGDLSRLRDDQNNTLTELASVKVELKATQNQLVQVTDFGTSCKASLTSLKAAMVDLASEQKVNMSDLATDVKKLRLNSQSSETNITTLQSEVSLLMSNLSISDSNLKTVQSQMLSVQTSLKSCESHLVSVNSDVYNLKTHPAKIVDLMTTQYKSDLLHPITSELVSLQSRLQSTNVKVTSLTSDVNTLQHSNIKAIESEVSGLKVDLSHTKGNLTRTKSDVRAIVAVQEDLKNRESSAQKTIQLVQTRLIQVGDQCAANSQSLEDLSGSFNKSRTFVLFTARSNHNLSTIHSNNILKLDGNHLNIGGGFHDKTGVFKAPVTGLYLFWAGIKCYERRSFVLSLIRESSRVVASSASSSNSASITHVTRVLKGQEVWFRTDHSLRFLGNGNSYYGGMLLH